MKKEEIEMGKKKITENKKNRKKKNRKKKKNKIKKEKKKKKKEKKRKKRKKRKMKERSGHRDVRRRVVVGCWRSWHFDLSPLMLWRVINRLVS